MRQFHFIRSETFCLIVALILALSPLSHGLHLASCDHSHGPCNTHHPGHGLIAPFFFQDNEQYAEGGEKYLVAINLSQANGGRVHNPATCPVCRTFAQLVKGQGLPPAQAEIVPQSLQTEKPSYGHAILGRIAFSKVFPRAPPAC